MRSFFICVSLLALFLLGHAYHENPKQCQILAHDFWLLCQSLAPQQTVAQALPTPPTPLAATADPLVPESLEEPVDEPAPSTAADPSWTREYVDELNSAHNAIFADIKLMYDSGTVSQEAWDGLEKKIVDYEEKINASTLPLGAWQLYEIRKNQLNVARLFPDDLQRYHCLLEKLSTDPLPKVAALARFARRPLNLSFTAIDGRTVDLAEMRGKVVLIQIWSPPCKPSQVDLPMIQTVYHRYHDRGLEVVGIGIFEYSSFQVTGNGPAPPPSAKEFVLMTLRHFLIEWPQFCDGMGTDSPLVKKFMCPIPSLWLVGKDGRLVTTNARENLDARVASLLQAP